MDFAKEVEKTLDAPEAHEKYPISSHEVITNYHMKEGGRLERLKRHSSAAFHFHLASNMLFARGEYIDAYNARCKNLNNSRNNKGRLLNGHLRATNCLQNFGEYDTDIGYLTLALNHSMKAINLAITLDSDKVILALPKAAKVYESMAMLKDDTLKTDDWASAFVIYDVLRSYEQKNHSHDLGLAIAKMNTLGEKIYHATNDDSYLLKGINSLKDLETPENKAIIRGVIQNKRSMLEDSVMTSKPGVHEFDTLFYGTYPERSNNKTPDCGYDNHSRLR